MRKLCISLLLIGFSYVHAIETPNTNLPGPHEVVSGEYHLPAQIYPEVMSDRETELWASMHYPKDLTDNTGKLPLVVLLHGNHSTCGYGSNPHVDHSCQYTDTGTCPLNYQVVQNHRGYDYLAEHLASWGFLVLSINTNRGINCGNGIQGDFGLNLARGRMVLKHLSLLYQWGHQTHKPLDLALSDNNATFVRHIDFANVGMFGHSRGGEGVRAAYNLYQDEESDWPEQIPGLQIKAIFELGAVDGQTNRILDANNIAWNQLIPLCDGDVSNFAGRYPFVRMMLNPTESVTAQKSLFQVWGANHNYFNTEWQTTDNHNCPVDIRIFDPEDIGSEKQQFIAKHSVLAFFKSHLGNDRDDTLNQNFNPLFPIPSAVTNITQVDRDFTPTPAGNDYLSVDEFDQPTGMNHSGCRNESNLISINHKNDDHGWPPPSKNKNPQRFASIKWQQANELTYFKAVMANPNEGINIQGYKTLDIRIGRKETPLNQSPTTDLSIQLEDGAGNLSNMIPLSDYDKLNGPVDETPLLHTVRIPLSQFHGFDNHLLRAVKFVFNKTEHGAIYLANVRFHKQNGLGSIADFPKVIQPMNARANVLPSSSPQIIPNTLNQMSVVKPSKHGLINNQATVEIRLTSQVPFEVVDSLPILQIGKQTFKLSHYPDKNNLNVIAFILTKKEYQQLNKRIAANLSYGKQWQFRALQ